MITKRIAWVDMAKGYGILLVIIGHLGAGIMGRWIYSFHIPLFFFLSGYVFNCADNFGSFIKKKIKGIIVPYFCLGIPMLIWYILYHYVCNGENSFEKDLNLVLKFILQRRMWTIWFLACLFFLNIMFYFAKKLLKKQLYITVFSVLSVILGLLYYKFVGIALPWNIDICFMAFPFFHIGNFYRTHESVVEKYFDKFKYAIPIFIVSGGINVICCYLSYKISGYGLEMFESSYGFAPFTYISAFAGILSVVLLAKHITLPPICYFGRYSLLYFAWHQTIMIPVSKELLQLFRFSIDETSPFWLASVYKAIQFIIIVAFITVLNEIIRRTKLRFMLGLKKEKA